MTNYTFHNQKKTSYIFYKQKESGVIATLEEWQSDSPKDLVRVKDLVTAGIEPITLITDGECFLANEVFPFWFGGPREGDEYFSEWACHATDREGNTYIITWRFPVIKGKEPEADCLPWEDNSHIYKVEAV